jgi:hypothetical protein
MFKDRLMIHFPLMHPQLLPDCLPSTISLMDPGHVKAGEDADARYFRSRQLVYEDRLALKFLEDSLQFGEQFKHASDAAYFRAGSMENFFSGSVQEIKSQLLSPSSDGSEELKKKLTDAQLLLLLGYHFEAQMLELGALQHKINASVQEFEENLGMSGEDHAGLGVRWGAGREGSLEPLPMDWQRLVIPFLWFVPPKAALVVSDPLILAAIQEQGVDMPPVSRETLARVFPQWDPCVAVSCTRKAVPADQWAELAGVKIPAQVRDKDLLLMGFHTSPKA